MRLSHSLILKTEFAQAMADRHGLTCGIYTIWNKPSKKAALISCWISRFRPAISRSLQTALRHGCNVFGEKPMAATMEEAREIVQIAEEREIATPLCKTDDMTRNPRLREMIPSGTIGRVGYVGADFFLGAHFGGFRDAMESPLILDMAIQRSIRLGLLLGQTPFRCTARNLTRPARGTPGMLLRSASMRCQTALCSVTAAPGARKVRRPPGRRTWRVTGEQGTALWDGSARRTQRSSLPATRRQVHRRVTRAWTRSELVWPRAAMPAAWTRCSRRWTKAAARRRIAATISRAWRWYWAPWTARSLGQKVDLRSILEPSSSKLRRCMEKAYNRRAVLVLSRLFCVLLSPGYATNPLTEITLSK